MKTSLGILAFFVLLFAWIYASPVPTGGDWNMLSSVIREWVYEGQDLYRVYPTTATTVAPYAYTPFATIILLPLALLPQRFIWTLLVISNQVVILAICRKFGIGLAKAILLMLSPPAFYNMIFGQVDIIFLALILLPEITWGFAALVKPQLLIGLLMESFRSRQHFLNSFRLIGAMSLLSLVFWDWPVRLAEMTRYLGDAPHNVMQGLWPWGIPLGMTMILLGFWKKDRLLYVAGSPFLSFYASTGSMIGLIITWAKYASTVIFAISWLVWWGAIFSRAF